MGQVIKLQAFIPSEKLQKMAQELCTEYSQQDIAERLTTLSRNMNREGELLAEESTGIEHLCQLVQGRDQQAAANDVLEIGAMIEAIAQGKVLERDALQGNNGHLKLFEPIVPRVAPPIKKCLEQISGWCLQMRIDFVDEQATELAKGLGGSGRRAFGIAERIVYLDETAGLLVKINALAEAVQAEISPKKRHFGRGER